MTQLPLYRALSLTPPCLHFPTHTTLDGNSGCFSLNPSHIPRLQPPQYSCILMYGKCLPMIPRNGKTVTARFPGQTDTLACKACKARLVSQRPLAGPPARASRHLACSGSFATSNNCNNHQSNGSSYCMWGGESAAALSDPIGQLNSGSRPFEWPQTLRAMGPAWVSPPTPPPPPSLPGQRSCTGMYGG